LAVATFIAIVAAAQQPMGASATAGRSIADSVVTPSTARPLGSHEHAASQQPSSPAQPTQVHGAPEDGAPRLFQAQNPPSGDTSSARLRREVSRERYRTFVTKAGLDAQQVAALDSVLVDVAADLDAARAELEGARRELDADAWLALQWQMYETTDEETAERIGALLTPEQLEAVGGTFGMTRAFPASTLGSAVLR
jgi:hypothetical protein